MTIWGNHSTTQYPDLFHCEVDGKNAAELVGDHAWLENEFIPTVAKRGAAIIEARGASSAASAANAAIDHVRDWHLGTPEGDWVSMAVPSDGSYGVPEGLISSFPCVCRNGAYEIVQGLEIDDSPGPGSTPRSPSWPRSATRWPSSASSEPPPRRQAMGDFASLLPRRTRPTRVGPVRCVVDPSRTVEVGGGDAGGQRHHLVDAPLQLLVADADDLLGVRSCR